MICYCLAPAGGYPHAADCPYPLYRGNERDVQLWQDARDRKRAELDRVRRAGRGRIDWPELREELPS